MYSFFLLYIIIIIYRETNSREQVDMSSPWRASSPIRYIFNFFFLFPFSLERIADYNNLKRPCSLCVLFSQRQPHHHHHRVCVYLIYYKVNPLILTNFSRDMVCISFGLRDKEKKVPSAHISNHIINVIFNHQNIISYLITFICITLYSQTGARIYYIYVNRKEIRV